MQSDNSSLRSSTQSPLLYDESCASFDEVAYPIIELAVKPPLDEPFLSNNKPQRYQINMMENLKYELVDYFHSETLINDTKSGFSNFREAINDEDVILEAFKALDLNKDSFISKDDLKTFLDYTNEAYTQEQLEQMIRMFDVESKSRVSYDIFKQFAKGEIFGLCNSFVPTEEVKANQKIFRNMMEHSDLETFQCDDFKKSLSKGLLNPQKLDGATKEVRFKEAIFVKSAKKVVTEKSYKERKQALQRHININVETLLHQYSSLRSNTLSFTEIRELFDLNMETAELLFDKDREFSSVQVVIEYINCTPLSPLQKMQKTLNVFSKKPNLILEDCVNYLSTLMPFESETTWQKRLKMVLSKKLGNLLKDLSKQLLIDTMLQYPMIFRL